MAKALKSPHGVLTTLLTTAVVHTAFIYIWEGKGTSELSLQGVFLQHYQASGFCSDVGHSCVTLDLFCEAPSTHYRLTSAVGQSVHGVAFVAETLKTTRGVHTCVITCPLEKTLIYICNQTRTDDMKAAQSVAAFIMRDFPPTETRFTF